MESLKTFSLTKRNIHAVPIVHYTMETAALVWRSFLELQPDCVAVELPETMTLQFLHAASRLPDISVVIAESKLQKPIYFLSEPCDPSFEALRCALENNIPAYCIDLDVDGYPDIYDPLPDPYAIQRIGLKQYYELYNQEIHSKRILHTSQDESRELYMAQRLKELSYSYERILFVTGMSHLSHILNLLDREHFPELVHAKRDTVQVCALSEKSCREVMAETPWITTHYEEIRESWSANLSDEAIFPPDRQKLIYQLYKEASINYSQNIGQSFPGYHFRNIMKFLRNYSHISYRLMPDLYQQLVAARGCVDHNYAYEVWELATDYPHLHNIDNLPVVDLTPEQVWGASKKISFHLKEKGKKGDIFRRRKKEKTQYTFKPSLFGICSYQPEDIAIEKFGDFLKKKGKQILLDETARSLPFSTSLEDGIDTKETIRHWHEKKLYVKLRGKPQGDVGSIVVIFDPDIEEQKQHEEKFSWTTTWLGEHEQESDMAFYATPMGKEIVGPGISRCQYGGFMMSYPPRRMWNVWIDPDYFECQNKPEVLLMAAIDYAAQPIIVYVANQPPRQIFKRYASRYNKKLIYIPIGQLSPIHLNKIRFFHVLEGHDKRDIADEYIY